MTEWMAFYRLEPWGSLWAMQLVATVVIACVSPWRKKNASPMKPSDVFSLLGEAGGPRRSTLEMMKAKARAWVLGMGGKVL
jgi:hypothetical protein